MGKGLHHWPVKEHADMNRLDELQRGSEKGAGNHSGKTEKSNDDLKAKETKLEKRQEKSCSKIKSKKK